MWNNLKIGKKLIISFIGVSILASVAGIISVFMIRNIDANYSKALVNYGFSQGDIGKALVTLSNGKGYVHDIIGFTDAEDIADAKSKLEDAKVKYQEYIKPVEQELTADEELAQYALIQNALAAYQTKRDEVLKLGDTIDSELSKQAQRLAVDEMDPLYDKVYDAWADLLNMNVETGTRLSDDLTSQSNASMLMNIAFSAIALVLSVAIGTIIARNISRPITACVNRLNLLAQGNLKAEVPVIKAKDETGMLADATKTIVDALSTIIEDEDYLLGQMADGNFDVTSKAADKYIGDFAALLESMKNINGSLSDTLTQINQSSDQVSSGSDQVSSGAQALSQGATEQASAVEELAATIAEISSQINENASNAAQANDKAVAVGTEATESNRRMQDMLAAMTDISVKSGEIGKIIKTIEDIAFQTNILALNAAVEAARAGAAGKGFAVVADEVRNLASKSAEASKNTALLIEGSLKAVENGTKIADDTAQSLGVVVEGVQDVASTIDKISIASKNQAQSAVQITTGIDQISSVVQTNSATAEESAAASEELSGQASMLKSLVGKFRLKNDAAATSFKQYEMPKESYNSYASAPQVSQKAVSQPQFSSGKY